MMVLGLGMTVAPGDLSFADGIPEWAAPFISTAVSRGLFQGYPDMTFRPYQVITREEMAAVIARAIGASSRAAEAGFGDDGEIAEWARAHVAAVKSLGLIQGYEDGTFRPLAVMTRAEACAVIWRLMNR